MQETHLKDWYIVDVKDEASPDLRVLIGWGIVASDPSGRWHPGDYVCTSPIQNVLPDGTMVTARTNYKPLGPGRRITVAATAWPFLRLGYSPDEAVEIVESRRMRLNGAEREGKPQADDEP